MDSEEREICNYLKSYPGQFVAAAEISRRAGGKHKFIDDPNWIIQPLNRLAEKGLVESDTTGHYRLKPKTDKRKERTRYISPEIQKILEKSGKNYSKVVEIHNPEDFVDEM